MKNKNILLVIIILMVLVPALLVVFQKRGDYRERIEDLDHQSDSLKGLVEERNRYVKEMDIRIDELNDSLRLSRSRENELITSYNDLENDYDDLADSVLKIPVDTSYRFLTDEAYPYEGQREYPFNEPQVRGIHLTYLEKIALTGMSINLVAQIDEKDYQIRVMDTVVIEQASQLGLMSESQRDLEQVIENKDGVIEIKDEQIKEVKRKKTFWQIAGGAIIVVLAVIAAGGN